MVQGELRKQKEDGSGRGWLRRSRDVEVVIYGKKSDTVDGHVATILVPGTLCPPPTPPLALLPSPLPTTTIITATAAIHSAHQYHQQTSQHNTLSAKPERSKTSNTELFHSHCSARLLAPRQLGAGPVGIFGFPVSSCSDPAWLLLISVG